MREGGDGGRSVRWCEMRFLTGSRGGPDSGRPTHSGHAATARPSIPLFALVRNHNKEAQACSSPSTLQSDPRQQWGRTVDTYTSARHLVARLITSAATSQMESALIAATHSFAAVQPI